MRRAADPAAAQQDEGRKKGVGGAGARGASGFGGVLAFCTLPPAIPGSSHLHIRDP